MSNLKFLNTGTFLRTFLILKKVMIDYDYD